MRTPGGRRPTGRRPAAKPHPTDVHVGQQLSLRRTALGMSQGKLAERLGITFQQVQKYERAANRISASVLYHLSRILEVRIRFFFPERDAAEGLATGFAEAAPEPFDSDPLRRAQTFELVEAYYRIADPKVRRHLHELARAFAASRRTSDKSVSRPA